MNFSQAVYFIVTQAKENTQTALNSFFRGIDSKIHMSQQAFSKLRSKFDHSPFEKIFKLSATLPYSEGYKYKTLYGYRVSAIDGTTIALPNLPKLLKEFGGYGAKADSPTARASIHYDILNDIILDASIDKTSVDERTMALRHIKNLFLNRVVKELLIFDRGYASKDMISELISNKLTFLFRIKAGFNKQIDKLPLGIHTIQYETGYGVTSLTVVKIKLSESVVEVLLTNIVENFTLEQYKSLYFMRWSVETKYDIVKNKLEIENFTGYSKNSILQDFYATMYQSNLLSIFTAEANEIVDQERNHKENKYQYKVNVNSAVGSLKYILILIYLAENIEKRISLIHEIIIEMTFSVIPVRLGRSISRPSNSRSVKFHHNHKSNC